MLDEKLWGSHLILTLRSIVHHRLRQDVKSITLMQKFTTLGLSSLSVVLFLPLQRYVNGRSPA